MTTLFERLARFVVRLPVPIVAIWLVVATLTSVALPGTARRPRAPTR